MKAILAATWLALLDRSYGDEAASIQTLTSLDGFGNLIPCARGCIAENGAPGCGLGEWGDNIAHAIGCDYNCKGKPYGARNSCYCRPDYMPTANSFLSACVKSRCVVGDYKIDLTSASSLYNGYCNSLGYFIASTTVGERSRTTLSAAGGRVTVTEPTGDARSTAGKGGDPTSVPSVSGPLPTLQAAPDSLSPAAQAAIALGVILCVLVVGLAGFIAWWRAKNANQLRHQELPVRPGNGGVVANRRTEGQVDNGLPARPNKRLEWKTKQPPTQTRSLA